MEPRLCCGNLPSVTTVLAVYRVFVTVRAVLLSQRFLHSRDNYRGNYRISHYRVILYRERRKRLLIFVFFVNCANAKTVKWMVSRLQT